MSTKEEQKGGELNPKLTYHPDNNDTHWSLFSLLQSLHDGRQLAHEGIVFVVVGRGHGRRVEFVVVQIVADHETKILDTTVTQETIRHPDAFRDGARAIVHHGLIKKIEYEHTGDDCHHCRRKTLVSSSTKAVEVEVDPNRAPRETLASKWLRYNQGR